MKQRTLVTSPFCRIAVVTMLVLTSAFPVEGFPGDLDPTFGVGGKVTTDLSGDNDHLWAAMLLADGKLSVVATDGAPGLGSFALLRYNSNGSLDNSYGTGGRVNTSGIVAQTAALQPDGKIVVAGTDTSFRRFALQRYNIDGSLDEGFGSAGTVITTIVGINENALSIAIQPDGKVVVAGYAQTGFSGQQKFDFAIARYTTEGSPDPLFGNGGKVLTDFLGFEDLATCVAIQSDGKIVVAGYEGILRFPLTFHQFAVARYNSNGTLDGAFGTGGEVRLFMFGGYDEANALALLPNGKMIVAGFVSINGQGDFGMARLNNDGSFDLSFGLNGKVNTDFSSEFDEANSIANSIVIAPDGKIILAGSKSKGPFDDFNDFALCRYTPDGSPDSGFGSGGKVTTDFFGFNNIANVALVQTDGKILLAGIADRVGRFAMGDLAFARYEGASFDACLQDDGSGNALRFNSHSGEYEFSNCNGLVMRGVATITTRGGTTTLQQNGPDRRLLARIDATGRGTASIQLFSQGMVLTISDRNVSNNVCECTH